LSLVDWTSGVTERRGHGRADGAVFSLTLPGGRVVAVCGHRLVVAQPYGQR
jgi:hypothetical protein